MALNDNLNFAQLVEDGLKSHLVEAISERLVNQLVDEFKEKATALVAEATKDIAINGIEHMRDMAMMRDELQIYINGVKFDKESDNK